MTYFKIIIAIVLILLYTFGLFSIIWLDNNTPHYMKNGYKHYIILIFMFILSPVIFISFIINWVITIYNRWFKK